MRSTIRLFQNRARLTLFSAPSCSLCDVAKVTLSKLQERRPFDYETVDIYTKGNDKWRKLYKYDIPVLHANSAAEGPPQPESVARARRLMHRFSEEEVEALMDQAEGRR